MPLNGQKTYFRADIEGLRAIAVLMVIVFHARLGGFRGGFIGVDIFFVLSGYLITGLLLRELEESGGINLMNFYARRIRRLLPASLVMLVATIFVARFVLPPFEQALLSRSALTTFTYLSNVYFGRASSDYFGTDTAENPLLHTWSLAVEEQFYFVWPLLLILIFRATHGKSFSRRLGWIMVGVAAVSLTSSLWLTSHNPSIAFFLMPPRAWEFAAGALASQMPRAFLQTAGAWWTALGWVGLATIVIAGFWISPADFPGAKALLPVLGTVVLLVAGAQARLRGIGRLLQMRWLLWIGQRSYSLYLWHWPLLVFAGVLVVPLSVGARLICIGSAFVLAEVTYRLIETPVRTSKYLQTRERLCVVCSLVVVAAGVTLTLAWHAWCTQTTSYRTFGIAMMDLPEDAKMGCEIGYGSEVPRECDFGDKDALKTVVLFGDSHIEQWLPAFQEIAYRENWKIALLVKSGCPALAITTWATTTGAKDHWCSTWRKLAIKRIQAMHPQAVVLSNFAGYKVPGEPETEVSLPSWSVGARETFDALRTSGGAVIYLRDTPWAGYPVTECLARDAWLGTHRCAALSRSAALNESIYQAQRAGADQDSGVSFIDLSDSICGPSECLLKKDQMIVYRDMGHLTGTFLRSLSTELEDALLRNAPALKKGTS